MTTTDQDEAAEQLIEYLAREVRRVCPPSLLADPVKWATDRVTAMREEHWKCVIPSQTVITARREGDPPTEEFLAAKAAITRNAPTGEED